jgi:shikimate kinase
MGKNIVLVGMPGSGKTTAGKELAGIMGYDFMDTDALLLERFGKQLKDIVLEDGLEYFKAVQEEVVSGIDVADTVIATGGSVIYSDSSMETLKRNAVVVYLKLELAELEKRLGPHRKLARDSGQSLCDLLNEREPLYERYSDISIECTGKDITEIAEEIVQKIGGSLKDCDSGR